MYDKIMMFHKVEIRIFNNFHFDQRANLVILRAKTVFLEKRAKVVISRAFLVKLEGINRLFW